MSDIQEIRDRYLMLMQEVNAAKSEVTRLRERLTNIQLAATALAQYIDPPDMT